MPSGLIFVIKGRLVRVGARFAREHALAEEPRSSRRFRWWHLEPEVLTPGEGETPPQDPSTARRRRPIRS